MKVALIAIHYKNNELTNDFVDQLLEAKLDKTKVQLFIVDNSANFEQRESTAANPKFANVEVVRPPRNLGYFGGAQYLLNQRILPSEFDYIIVSNTDIEMNWQEFYQVLAKQSFSPEVAVIGPALISGLSKLDTNPYMKSRPTRQKMEMLKTIFSHWLTCQGYQLAGLVKAYFRQLLAKSSTSLVSLKTQEVYAIHGGFMIFAPSYFAAGGDFDNPVFLYNEEIFVAEFCLRKGLKSLYVPELRVFHKEHGAIGLFYSRQILKYKAEAAAYFADHYFKDE